MNKRKSVLLITSIVIIAAVVLVLVDRSIIKKVYGNRHDAQVSKTAGTVMTEEVSAEKGYADENEANVAGEYISEAEDGSANPDNNSVNESSKASEGAESLLKSEIINVDSNTPEYDMELRLCEGSDKKTFLRLRYYLDGASVINDIDDSRIPELKDIFENRESAVGNKESYKIKQALLNPIYSQLYVMICGSAADKYVQTSLYQIGVDDGSVKMLMSYPGEYGKMSFNKDKSLMIYSFADPPHMSQYQESTMISIFDCKKAEFIIKSSRDISGNLMGSNSCSGYVYDYEFTSWQMPRTVRLKQTVKSKNDTGAILLQGDVLYDIDKNLILNMDGSTQELSEEIGDGSTRQSETAQQSNGTQQEEEKGTGGGQDSERQSSEGTDKTGETEKAAKGPDSTVKKGESEQVKLLRSFYSYLGSEEDYKKAMDLLDKDFVFRMELLKQFGVECIVKSDFDAEDASMYSQLLKTAKFDTIAGEDLKDGICTISYYHYLGADSESQLRQLMVARLKKSDGLWKIISIEEGKE